MHRWGSPTLLVNALADTNRLQWKGLLAEGGLCYARNRWYDPQARRFLSEDPLGLTAGPNLYPFGGNDPVNARDPLGLAPCTRQQIAEGFGTYYFAGEPDAVCLANSGAGSASPWSWTSPPGLSSNFGNPCARGGSCGKRSAVPAGTASYYEPGIEAVAGPWEIIGVVGLARTILRVNLSLGHEELR